MIRLLSVAAVTILCLSLAACGSSTGPTGPAVGTRPIAVATAEPTVVDPGGKVTLRGAGSSDPAGSTLSFHWGQSTSNPFPVPFSDNDSPTAFAVCVTLTDGGSYAFILTVENERRGRSLPDTVVVMADRAPVANAGPDRLVEVGTKLPNPWGLYDMHGNAWEWCLDWLGDYPRDSQTDPAGPDSGPRHVLRGGDFARDANGTRSADRGFGTPDRPFHGSGARLVRIW